MSYPLVQALMQELRTSGSQGNKLIPRREWREGLRLVSLEVLRAPDELQSLLTLESFTAPVMPPLGEATFNDFRRPGRGPPIPMEPLSDRAIALHQLAAVLSHVERRCEKEGWRGRADERLSHYSVNVYDLMGFVIKPATARHRCSFVEFVSVKGQPQPSEWFVAHWWGMPVGDTSRSLMQHARDRHLDHLSTCYWMAEYSLNQWDLRQPIEADPLATPFFNAMVRSRGAVALVDSKQKCLDRIWWTHEVVTSLERAETHGPAVLPDGFEFDIYAITSGAGTTVGLTEGMVAIDGHKDSHRDARQASFPLAAAKALLNLCVHEGDASTTRDKQHILNLMAERPLRLEPLKFEWQYVQVNHKARARLIFRLLRPALAQGGDAYESLLDALRKSRLRTFEASFMRTDPVSGVTGFSQEACGALLRHMPAALNQLNISVPLERLPTDVKPFESHSLQALEKLSIIKSPWLVVLPDWLGDLPCLKYLFLNECPALRALPGASVLRRLTHLELIDLSGCSALFSHHGHGLLDRTGRPKDGEPHRTAQPPPKDAPARRADAEIDMNALMDQAEALERALYESGSGEESDAPPSRQGSREKPTPTGKAKTAGFSRALSIGRTFSPARPGARLKADASGQQQAAAGEELGVREAIDLLMRVAQDAGHPLLVIDARGMPLRSKGRFHAPRNNVGHFTSSKALNRFLERPYTPAEASGAEPTHRGAPEPLPTISSDDKADRPPSTPSEVRRPPSRANETKHERIQRLLVFEHDRIQARIEGLFSQLDDDGTSNFVVHDDGTAVEERVRRVIDDTWPGEVNREW